MSQSDAVPKPQKTPYQPFEIRLPDEQGLDQDEEWCHFRLGDKWQRLRFHDYEDIYRVPGLYECLFYRTLKCCSPQRVVSLLDDVLSERPDEFADLRVLDVGAGNGMVGQELKAVGAHRVIGVDICAEAKTATHRDRPGIYSDYLITDLTDLPEQEEKRLRGERLNCLTTVAALGFGDIPPAAFVTALRVLETPGWLAFNLKENFLSDTQSGFSNLVRTLSEEGIIRFEAYRRYQHRLSVTGKPLFYVAMIAKKMREIPESYLKDFGE